VYTSIHIYIHIHTCIIPTHLHSYMYTYIHTHTHTHTHYIRTYVRTYINIFVKLSLLGIKILITEYTSSQIRGCPYKHAVTIVELCLFYLIISMAVGNKEKMLSTKNILRCSLQCWTKNVSSWEKYFFVTNARNACGDMSRYFLNKSFSILTNILTCRRLV
jgi:hypothetical protein